MVIVMVGVMVRVTQCYVAIDYFDEYLPSFQWIGHV